MMNATLPKYRVDALFPLMTKQRRLKILDQHQFKRIKNAVQVTLVIY